MLAQERNTFIEKRRKIAAQFNYRRMPGHALHEAGLQRQTGVSTLVSSQERRPLAVMVINSGQTCFQPVVDRLSTAGFLLHPLT